MLSVQSAEPAYRTHVDGEHTLNYSQAIDDPRNPLVLEVYLGVINEQAHEIYTSGYCSRIRQVSVIFINRQSSIEPGGFLRSWMS